jgi:hypothetical protein
VHTIPWVHLMYQAQGENKLERFKRSWQPVKSSWSVLRSDKELLLFPVILGIVMFIALGVLVLAWLGSGGLDRIDGHGDGFGLLDVFLLYLLYFVVSTVASSSTLPPSPPPTSVSMVVTPRSRMASATAGARRHS